MLVDDHEAPGHKLPARHPCIASPLPAPAKQRGLDMAANESELPRLVLEASHAALGALSVRRWEA
jgi:hypothetical protein